MYRIKTIGAKDNNIIMSLVGILTSTDRYFSKAIRKHIHKHVKK